MPDPAHKQRSDYAAGICLTILLAGAMTAIFAIMGARKAEPTGPEYIITVPISTGVAGIDTSSTLSYGGLVVGQVTSVEYRDDRMEVKVRLNRRLNIHKSVQIVKESSLLGGTTNLVITDLGNRAGTNRPLESGQVIPISDSPSGVSGILGQKGAESIDSITENIESSAKGLRGIVESMRSNQELVMIRDNYEALASGMQSDLPTWEARYEAIARRVDRMQSKSDAWYDQFDGISASFERTDRSFTEVTRQLEDVRLKKLEESFDELVDATRQASARFERSVIPLADELVMKARASWEDMSKVYSTIKDLATRAKDTIDYALAQTTLASQQLTLTINEVIGSLGIPLLERPSEEEVNLMARYAAMSEWSRSAVQMQELLGTLASMPKLTESGTLEEQATMARMIDLLRASIADYEAAQDKFDQLTRLHQTGSSRRDGVDDPDQ